MGKIGNAIDDAERWRVAEALRSVEAGPGVGKFTQLGLALYGKDYLRIPNDMQLAAVCTRLAALIEPIPRRGYDELVDTAESLHDEAETLREIAAALDCAAAEHASIEAGQLEDISARIRWALGLRARAEAGPASLHEPMVEEG